MKKNIIIIRKYELFYHNEKWLLTYSAGKLSKIEFETAPSDANSMNVYAHLHGTEEETIARLKKHEGMIITEIKVLPADQKIALWYELYKIQYSGMKYKITPSEARKVKNVEFTQELITKFFNNNEWWAKEKTIARYCNNINELRRTENKGSEAETKRQSNRSNLATAFQQRYKN